MEKKRDIPIFYLYIHFMMKQRYRELEVSRKDVTSYLFEWRIPSDLRSVIIRELELFGLLDASHRRLVKLFESPFKLEDINKYKESIGMFENCKS